MLNRKMSPYDELIISNFRQEKQRSEHSISLSGALKETGYVDCSREGQSVKVHDKRLKYTNSNVQGYSI